VDDPAFEAAKRQAEEQVAMFAGLQVVTEAELVIRGIWPVSVVHGDAETAEDAELIYGALRRLAEECGPLAGTAGGNDYTTFLFTGPSAEDNAATFIARAQAMEHPRWWRITATAHPVWH
jgi:hypothetical protein